MFLNAMIECKGFSRSFQQPFMESKSNSDRIVSANFNEKKWLVIYTRPRWEKKIDKLLKQQGIESYCPVNVNQNQWSDRKRIISVPIFTSYVFVKVTLREEFTVLYTMGVMGFVSYMGRPAIVPDNVIEQIKNNLAFYKNVEVVSLKDISIGDRVIVKDGVFINKQGQVVQIHGKHVLMVLDNIHCALVTHIPFQNLAINN
jgi:transcription antitermination factor NusG